MMQNLGACLTETVPGIDVVSNPIAFINALVPLLSSDRLDSLSTDAAAAAKEARLGIRQVYMLRQNRTLSSETALVLLSPLVFFWD